MAVSKKENKVHFVCQNCGNEAPRWLGRCPECGGWNSFIEEKIPTTSRRTQTLVTESRKPVPLSEIEYDYEKRFLSQCSEFNRVLGGGIVPGSILLLGGEPGIGKSTLMLQEAAQFAKPDFKVLYVSGEESTAQTKLRAARLGLNSADLFILAETNVEQIIQTIDPLKPQLIVVDSIQTIFNPHLQSAPGSVSQVRECALQFLTVAKSNQIPIFLIGHVTKDGYLAGPKVLEHMVDTLLFFEGDKDHFYRLIRSVKNRFGSTNEIGVFEMTEKGLVEVANPSAIFLSERTLNSPGTSIICLLEGTRPILVEIQALASPTNYGLPQRNSTGIDAKRLAMLLAVLEKRAGMRVGTADVFVNVVGGIRITETSADLGIVLALASSLKNRPLDPKTIFIGEVGLTGEVRSVSKIEMRLREAMKMGFTTCVIPKLSAKAIKKLDTLKIVSVETVSQTLNLVLN